MVQSVLPLSEQISLAASVLIQGVELNTITVPLHRVYLRSSLITGPVVVGVRSTLPVTGVSFILGSDLARGKVDAMESVGVSKDIDHPPFSREQLIHSQEMDPEVSQRVPLGKMK